MSENSKRILIDEETVEKIAGGRFCYDGQGEYGIHYMWSDENPDAVYAFEFSKMPQIGKTLGKECYNMSDADALNYLVGKGLITPA